MMRKFLFTFWLLCWFSAVGIATDVTIATHQIPQWTGQITGIELRVFLSATIVTPEGQTYTASSPTTGVTQWRYPVTFTNATVNGIVIYTANLPSVILPATTNVVSGYSGRFEAWFYRNGVKLAPWAGFNSFRLANSPATTTWPNIAIYNNTTIPTADTSTYTKAEIDALLIACCSGSSNGITVKDTLVSAMYSDITILDIEQASGFVLSNPSSGRVLIQIPDRLDNKTLGTATRFELGSDSPGDTYYANASGFLTILPIGADGQVLTVGVTGVPGWEDPVGGGGGGITSLNTLTTATQTFSVSTAGTDFTIESVSNNHAFKLPSASPSARGLVTTGTQLFAGGKVFLDPAIIRKGFGSPAGSNVLFTFEVFGDSGRFDVKHALGTEVAPSATTSGSELFRVAPKGYTGSAYSTVGVAGLTVTAEETFGASAQGARTSILTTPIGGTGTYDGVRVTGIGTSVSDAVGLVTNPVASAAFQINSTARGLLPPRLTSTQRTAISSPAEGLTVFQTDGGSSAGLYQYVQSAWGRLARSSEVSGMLPTLDTTSLVEGSSDATKEIRFEVDGLTTATVRVLTPQDANYILAGTNIAQTVSGNQTFTGAVDASGATSLRVVTTSGAAPTTSGHIGYNTTSNTWLGGVNGATKTFLFTDSSGASLTTLNASQLTSGTVPLGRLSGITNTEIASGAAIALLKLATVTASRALVSDGSGFISAATTTSTEIGYVNGVTSAIQTQLNNRPTFSYFGSTMLDSGGFLNVNQGYNFVWTALHTFNLGTTPQESVRLTVTDRTTNGDRDSDYLAFRSHGYNGGTITYGAWRIFSDATDNDGTSGLTFRNSVATTPTTFTEIFRVNDYGGVKIPAIDVTGGDGDIWYASTGTKFQFTENGVTKGLTRAIGTANQVLVNAGSGTATDGDVTLTLPQAIATTSTPQFARLGLGAAADATKLLRLNGGGALVDGSNTLSGAADGLIQINGTLTSAAANANAVIRARPTFSVAATGNVAGIDVVPTFNTTANITVARGAVLGGTFNPAAATTITNADAINYTLVMGATAAGAITNIHTITVNSPIQSGTLIPTNTYGVHVNNQAISGATNVYGLYVDAQSGGTNNYSAIFAGGFVGINQTVPTTQLQVVSSSASTVAGRFDSAASPSSDILQVTINGTKQFVITKEGAAQMIPIATPANPASSNEGNVYVKGGKLVFQYNDAGTVRYKYLDLTGTGVTWVHTTTAP